MRRLAALFLAFTALPALAQFNESVTVARILLDVRVTDFNGDPIAGLGPADFEVRLGGERAEVLTVTWVDESTVDGGRLTGSEELPSTESTVDGGRLTGSEELPSTVHRPTVNRSPGRLFVLFVQTDFSRATERIRGQMHFFTYAERMLEMLEPEDRVAVFSFDSHLKLRLDFTSDKEQILAALKETLLIDHPPPPPAVPEPSLAPRLDREAMKRARDSETALTLVANALRPIPGPKSMLLMGWGLGEFSRAGVRMKPRYRLARNALDAARVTVFSLDMTAADYHSLEVGLSKAAADTGGFYAKTHIFPMVAIKRLRRTLEGHYELELRRPDLKPGTHELTVRVKRRGVHVLAPSSWMDR